MAQRMLVMIIASTLIKGVPVSPGTPDEPTIMELDAADAQILICNSKAVRHTPAVDVSPENMAAALALAKTELLERIAAAADIVALDELLSEDPDVVAAYETRLSALEDAEQKAKNKTDLLARIAAVTTKEEFEGLIVFVADADQEITQAWQNKKDSLG